MIKNSYCVRFRVDLMLVIIDSSLSYSPFKKWQNKSTSSDPISSPDKAYVKKIPTVMSLFNALIISLSNFFAWNSPPIFSTKFVGIIFFLECIRKDSRNIFFFSNEILLVVNV